ncbi:MAG: hypothetical protein U1F25_19815 [Rubrivivax sp.]
MRRDLASPRARALSPFVRSRRAGAARTRRLRPKATACAGQLAFGTVSWAQSNRAYRYQRFIDDDGTFERDTLLGAQVDVRLTRWSATLQARLAPSITEEKRWDVMPTWAFVA